MTMFRTFAMIVGGLLLGDGGFDGTREFGPIWQGVGALLGAMTGAIGGLVGWLYLASKHTDDAGGHGGSRTRGRRRQGPTRRRSRYGPAATFAGTALTGCPGRRIRAGYAERYEMVWSRLSGSDTSRQ